jgi:hypothetical protein
LTRPPATHTTEVVYRDRPSYRDDGYGRSYDPEYKSLDQSDESWWGNWFESDISKTRHDTADILWEEANSGCGGENGVIHRYESTLHKYPTDNPYPFPWIQDQYIACIESRSKSKFGNKPRETELA